MKTEQVSVLNNGWVQLVDTMPAEGMDEEVVRAARVSYNNYFEDNTDEKAKAIIDFMMKFHHGSPFEMGMFKFVVRAPVCVWWNWVRHRMCSYNLESSRFHKMKLDYYYPDKFRLKHKKNKQASSEEFVSESLNTDFISRLESIHELSDGLYKDMLKAGVSHEQARLALPFASVFFTGAWAVNARSLMNFLSLRQHEGASVEIQAYAQEIEKIFADTCPVIYDAYNRYFLPRVHMFTDE